MPIEIKSASLTIKSIIIAAEGVSIKAPIFIFSLNSTFSFLSSNFISSINFLVSVNSSKTLIIGIIISISPKAEALKSAFNCSLNTFLFDKQNLIARHPKKGLSSFLKSIKPKAGDILSPPISKVLIIIFPFILEAIFLYTLN